MRRQIQPALARVLYALIVVAGLPFLIWNGPVQQWSASWNDLLMRMRATQQSTAVDRIVLAEIDDETASRYGPLPLSRRTLAEGFDALAEAQPQVVTIDLLISEPGVAADDTRLAQAIRRLPAVVMGAALQADKGQWILPLQDFRREVALGHVHAAPDPDGIVRSVLLAKEGEGRRIWALGFETARLAMKAGTPVEARDSITVGAVRIPSPERTARTLVVNFAGPTSSFPRVSFADLIDRRFDPAKLRGKIVIVGATAQGTGDRLFTPVSTGIGTTGAEIHANVVRTILDQAFLVPLTTVEELVSCLVLAFGCLMLQRFVRGFSLFLGNGSLALMIVIAGFAAPRLGLLLPLGSFVAVCLTASIISGLSEHAILNRALSSETEKRKEYAFRVQAIAHEIKTPLTAIQGSSEMISEEAIPEGQRVAMAGLIYKESKRLTTMIQTFLNVERLAAGSLSLQRSEIDLAAMVKEVAERGRLYAARKHISIEVDAAPVLIKADAEFLSFAIYNLITNAVKYSPKNATVQVSARQTGREAIVIVKDEGFGIAPTDQKRIFEKFYRLSRDEKSAEEGTGIGLALVKEIVQQHGGRIEVDSSPGKGSCFAIHIPGTPSGDRETR